MRLEHKHKRRDRSKLSEKKLARTFGGKVQPASGALPVAKFKGDVVTPHFLFDDKTTQAGSFSVNLSLMQKLKKEAFRVGGKIPVISVNFEGRERLFVLTERDFVILAKVFSTTKGD